MSTLKSSAEDLTLNADGSGNDVIIQSNGSTKAIITHEGNVGIGDTSPSSYYDATVVINGGSDVGLTLVGTGTSALMFADGSSGAEAYAGRVVYHHGVDRMTLHANGGTERVEINSSGDVEVKTGNLVIGTAGKGIDFSAQTATSATGAASTSELLDHYEEGTWTPVLHDASNNLGTMHALTGGQYTKIGRVVTVTGNVRTTSTGSASGGLYISGLPFNSATGNGFHAAGAIANAENMAITASESLTMYMAHNSSKLRIDIYDSTGATTPMTESQWSSDGQIGISVTYFAA
jgi:hypothetical protein